MNNNNLSYFNDAAYNRKFQRAALLSGDARMKAYGDLDADVMKNAAPIAPYIATNAKILVGEKVGCYTYDPIGGVTNLTAVCLK